MADKKEYEVKDGKLEVTETKEEIKVATHDYKDLIAQKQRIQDQKDRDNVLRDEEMAFIDELIAKAKEFALDTTADAAVEVEVVK